MTKNALLYTVTRADVRLLAISIASVLDHYHSPEPLDILVFAADIFNTDIELIRSLPALYHKSQANIFIFTPPAEANQVADYHNDRFPMVVTWRLYGPNRFPEYQRLLYLDNDTLIYTDVTTIFGLCPDDQVLAAVPDFYYDAQRGHFDIPDTPELTATQNYFNSGVMLFNVPLYNQRIRPEMITKMLNEKTYNYPDQTVINRLAAKQTALIGLEYNYQKDDSWLTWVKNYHPDTLHDFEVARQHIKIRHFVGYLYRSRPWQHLASYDEFERDFWHYEMAIRQYFMDQSVQRHYDAKTRLHNAYLDDNGNAQ